MPVEPRVGANASSKFKAFSFDSIDLLHLYLLPQLILVPFPDGIKLNPNQHACAHQGLIRITRLSDGFEKD
jgi:hypothetical protein